jgi:hypothetical protein
VLWTGLHETPCGPLGYVQVSQKERVDAARKAWGDARNSSERNRF